MWSAKRIGIVAVVVGGYAWLQGPAFRESEGHLPRDEPTTPSLAHQTRKSVGRFERSNEATEEPKTFTHRQQAAPSQPPQAARTLAETRKTATPPLTQTTNVLILGLDRKPGKRGLGRPDTLVVAALSDEHRQLGLISIPRDLYVDIDGHGPDRINAAFSVALNSKRDPAELVGRVIEDTFALSIDHTLSVDLRAFEALVDALGGVDVHVPCPIFDNFIDPRTESGRRILDVDAGLVQMDGITAALYARSRHGRSDWNRARRQQAILLGIKQKFLTMDGFSRLGDVVSTLERHVKSDMNRAEMLSLGAKLAQLSSEDIHGLVLGAKEAVPTRLEDGKEVLVPDHAAIEAAFARLFSAPAPGTQPRYAKCFDKDAAITAR